MERTFIDFCSGIGGGRIGLEECGFRCIGRSDTSKLSDKTYTLMFDVKNEKNYGNIKRIKNLPDFDIMIAGFPCQSFSVIGRKEGFEDSRGQIIYYLIKILEDKKPSAFLLENVKGLVTHNNGETFIEIVHLLDNAGYDVYYQVLNSIDFGVPQMRKRVYIVGFNKTLGIHNFVFPNSNVKTHISDYLVCDLVASENNTEYIRNVYLHNRENEGKYVYEDLLKMNDVVFDCRMNDLRIYHDRMPTLRAQRDGIYYPRDGILYQLSGYEALLLQGFPKHLADKVKNQVSDRHLLMQAGNAMTTKVIKEIGTKINEALDTLMRR